MRVGTTVRIRRLVAAPIGRQRWRELGFREDSWVRVVAKSARLICQVGKVRLALSNALAAQMLVESLPVSAGRR